MQTAVSRPTPSPRVYLIQDAPLPRVPPAYLPPELKPFWNDPIAHCNLSWKPLANVITPSDAACRKFTMDIINKWEMSVIDKETGQIMDYKQLRKHPKFSDI